MPNFYSHLVLAKIFLEKNYFGNSLEELDLNNFYFGAVSPDIGYFSGIERKITHFYEDNPKDFFDEGTFSKNSFLKGYLYHLNIDNVWKYKIRLKKTINIEENSKIYKYLDEFLKNKFNVDFDYFLPFILNGNCEFLKKFGIQKETCEIWKQNSFYGISKFQFNENYQEIVDEYLKLLKINNYI